MALSVYVSDRPRRRFVHAPRPGVVTPRGEQACFCLHARACVEVGARVRPCCCFAVVCRPPLLLGGSSRIAAGGPGLTRVPLDRGSRVWDTGHVWACTHPRNRLAHWAGSWLQPPSSRTNLSLPASGCEDSPIGCCGVCWACSTAAACTCDPFVAPTRPCACAGVPVCGVLVAPFLFSLERSRACGDAGVCRTVTRRAMRPPRAAPYL